MQELIRREVEVITPEVVYRGVLMDVSEAEVALQSLNGWITIPMEKILDIRAVD